jgi:cytochrome c biogenesis protein
MRTERDMTAGLPADEEAAEAGPESVPGGTSGHAHARLGVLGWLRWAWRQLTSMRTALILLFLLAVASVPGSVLPQEGIDPAAVSQYYTSHPALAPILNRLSLFSVFAAPWFAAIYLLLFASLAGCVLPRTFRLVGSARQKPPRAPRNLARLPSSSRYITALPPDQALSSAANLFARKRFRLHVGDGWVSAEKGYLREVGNLLFHIALLALLFSVGLGGIWGYKANRLLVVGQGYANTPTAMDAFHPGRLVGPNELQPFSLNLLNFSARYVSSGPQIDQPISYDAGLSYQTQPGAPVKHYVLQVNHPLVVDSVSVYLIGHGYAPIFKVTDGKGNVRWDGPVPFIPVDSTTLTSEGVVKVPDAVPDQLGFAGVFLPSADAVNGRLESVFPAALNPQVSLVAFTGNLNMNSGVPQSVYTLDTAGLHRLPIAPQPLSIGQSMKLPDGAGTITYTGYKQWISLAITYDPGQLPALCSAIAALAGLILSFMVRRRRVFVRAVAAAGGGSEVTFGGLARSDAAGGFEAEFAELAQELQTEQNGALAASPPVEGTDPPVEGASPPVEGDPGRDDPDSPGGHPLNADEAAADGVRQQAALTGREGE